MNSTENKSSYTSNFYGDYTSHLESNGLHEVAPYVRRATPNGTDPSMKINLLSENGVQELHLVLYDVHTKFIRFLGKIGGERITHLITAWTDTGEIMAAFWASAPYWASKLESISSLDDAAYRVMYDVYTTMQKGEIPESLMEARLDEFQYVPGEYEESEEEEENDDEAFGNSFISKVAEVAEDVAIDALRIAANAGLEALESELNGEEEDEEDGDDNDDDDEENDDEASDNSFVSKVMDIAEDAAIDALQIAANAGLEALENELNGEEEQEEDGDDEEVEEEDGDDEASGEDEEEEDGDDDEEVEEVEEEDDDEEEELEEEVEEEELEEEEEPEEEEEEEEDEGRGEE